MNLLNAIVTTTGFSIAESDLAKRKYELPFLQSLGFPTTIGFPLEDGNSFKLLTVDGNGEIIRRAELKPISGPIEVYKTKTDILFLGDAKNIQKHFFYEYRFGMLILGIFDWDYHFVPIKNSKVKDFSEYKYRLLTPRF